MEKIEVIYARQSVDKKDSISIETQINECTKKLDTKNFRTFYDKGYSGKSMDRPQFQEMMNEVRKGIVSKIIIYKFDRISRSLIDFLSMQQEFSEYGVKLISCSEDFDTSTQVGKMILNILMMFAEMERESIQQRIRDNYYARGEKGFYLGGPPPYGYTKVETTVDGLKTYTFKENKEESDIVKKIYNDYINGKSMGEIAKGLNKDKVISKRNKPWSETVVARILRNPVYVKANADIYNYLQGLGGTMTNPVEAYTGGLGCYVYGNAEKRKGSKFTNLKNDYVSLGLHKGIIESSLWLNVQMLINKKKNHSNLGTGSLSWLQGLVKCKCGYTYYVKKYKNSYSDTIYKYLYCRGRKNDSCPYPKTMIAVKDLEDIAEIEILSRLEELKALKNVQIVHDTPEINELKIQLSNIEKKIENIVERIAEGSDVSISYLNKHIEKLDAEKNKILEEIAKQELKENKLNSMNLDIDYVLDNWCGFSLETKKKVAKEIIEEIILEDRTADFIFY